MSKMNSIDSPLVASSKPVSESSKAVTEVRLDFHLESMPVRAVLDLWARLYQVEYQLPVETEMLVTLSLNHASVDEAMALLAQHLDLGLQKQGGRYVFLQEKTYWESYTVQALPGVRQSTQSMQMSVGNQNDDPMGQSQTRIQNQSEQSLWGRLEAFFQSILQSEHYVLMPEAGMVVVHSDWFGHRRITRVLSQIHQATNRQVWVEMTVVEVELSEQFQAGIDWSVMGKRLSASQNQVGSPQSGTALLNYVLQGQWNLDLGLRLLNEMGQSNVVSKPKLRLLNHQTSLMKVVDHLVYFTTDAETSQSQTQTLAQFSTELHTVPVGFVLALTPSINESHQVMLNVRPSLSRVVDYQSDPNPSLADAGVVSRVPVVRSREMDLMLSLQEGDSIMMGGLMQDAWREQAQSLPGEWDVNHFQAREKKTTELVLLMSVKAVR